MKPFFLLNYPDSPLNHSKAEHHHSMAPVPYPDLYFGASMSGYGPHGLIQPQMAPQMLGIAPGRLPLEIAEDGPIYVNAKQYHGILRRRQSRAKLEAKNKLVKARKPYLHESRHKHALNRVRGSGGRFLSTKKLQQCVSKVVNGNHPGSNLSNFFGKTKTSTEGIHFREYASSVPTCSDTGSESCRSVSFRQSERKLFVNSNDMGGALPCSGRISLLETNTAHLYSGENHR